LLFYGRIPLPCNTTAVGIEKSPTKNPITQPTLLTQSRSK
jgi:hypothetical protein